VPPNPTPSVVLTGVRGSEAKRSWEARYDRQKDITDKRLVYYLQHVTTIEVPFALEDMHKDMHNKSLDSICDNDLADISPQCFSAKFVDKNKNPILFYFGFRHKEPKHRYGVSALILKPYF
jgi:hypothetical protein